MAFVGGVVHAQTHRFSVAVVEVVPRSSCLGEVGGENCDVRACDMGGRIVMGAQVHRLVAEKEATR